MGGVATKMIERNTTIPTRRSEVFTTASDAQPEVEVHVLQGEREMASDNKSLGKFNLTGIPPAPRGVPQVEVTFDIDANGIVSVSAKDLGTGKQQQITITGGTALPKDEIDQMMTDAEAHATDDKERREKAEARNQADHVSYQTAKMLDEYGDKLTDDEKSGIQGKIDELKEILEDQEASAERLRTATDAVLSASQVLGEKVYEASQAEAAAGESGNDDEVVEAEIVDEGDES
jgi:molecular chaperone DnaK